MAVWLLGFRSAGKAQQFEKVRPRRGEFIESDDTTNPQSPAKDVRGRNHTSDSRGLASREDRRETAG